jgi:ATP adenylyltransferase/5',5'''-P-1,P-4-tetraphosphate phosphorylase II
MTNLSRQIEDLFAEQIVSWKLAGINYKQLKNVRIKRIDFGSFGVTVQYNPERIRSSAAKVDPKSIGERPCFLCTENRPIEQKGILTGNGMIILVNPFPIFSKHLTIPSLSHTDQRIKGNFETMLDLAASLQDYVIFYNGPQCGASAPDHFHFQAGNRTFLPIEADFEMGRSTRLLSYSGSVSTWSWKNYLRGILTLSSDSKADLVTSFDSILEKFSRIQAERAEPMLNCLALFQKGKWIIHFIPRKLHRPSHYFAEGDAKIIFSPASVDIGGVLITPREEDFNRLNESIVADIFSQVCYEEDEVNNFI